MVRPLFDVPDRDQIRALVLRDQEERQRAVKKPLPQIAQQEGEQAPAINQLDPRTKPGPLTTAINNTASDVTSFLGGVYSSWGQLTPEEQEAEQALRREEARQAGLTNDLLRQQRAAENAEIAKALGEEVPTSYVGTDVPIQTIGDRNVADLQAKADGPPPTLSKARSASDAFLRTFAQSALSVAQAPGIAVDSTDYMLTGDESESEYVRRLDEVSKAIKAALPGDPTRNGELLEDLASGTGSLTSMMVGGLTTKALGFSVKTGSTILGVTASGVGGYEDAKANNATTTAKYLSFYANSVLGLSERIPVANAIDRAFGELNRATNGRVAEIIAAGAVNSLEELVQELGQGVGQNAIAKVLYDKEREIFQGVADQATVGGILGFFFGGGTAALSQAMNRPAAEPVQPYQPARRVEQTPIEPEAPTAFQDAQQQLNDLTADLDDPDIPTPPALDDPGAFSTGSMVGKNVSIINGAGAGSAAEVVFESELGDGVYVRFRDGTMTFAKNGQFELTDPAGSPEASGLTPDGSGALADLPPLIQEIAEAAPPPPRDQIADASTVSETSPTPGKSAGLFLFDATSLGVDAERFQFKAGGDQEGVTNRLKGVKRWDPAKANQLMVWQSKDGELFVVDGHQRSGLARRLVEQGLEQDIKIPGLLYRETDGFTPEKMRALAAGKNLAEGSGTLIDAAKVLKIDPQLIDESMPVTDYKIRQATDLAKLGDEPFRMVINEVTDPEYGAIVGRLIPDNTDQQTAAISALNKIGPANAVEAELVVRRVLNSQIAEGADRGQGGLFGDALDTPESTVIEEIKIVAKAMAELKKDKAVFARVVKNADKIESVGSRINREASEGIVSESDRAIILLTTQSDTAGPVRTQLLELAKDLKQGKVTASAASRKLAETIRSQPAFKTRGGDDDDMPIAAMRPQRRATVDQGTMDLFTEGAQLASREASQNVRRRAEQLTLDGMGPSARQLAASREAAARGMVRGSKPQADANQGLFADRTDDGGFDFMRGSGNAYPIAPRSEWYADANYEQTGGRLVYMTPDEYLAQVRPLQMDEATRENIEDLKQHIQSGKTLDPLAIYTSGREDGRHRAMAAKELGISQVPVLVWGGADADVDAMLPRLNQLQSWKDGSPLKTTEQLTAAAAKEKAAFDKKIRKVAREVGIGYKAGPLKKAERITEKVRDKRYPSAAYVTDAVRGSLYSETPDQANAAAEKIIAAFGEAIDEGWFVNFVGYADRKVLIRLKSGVIAEIQILEPSLADAKDNKGGHDLYDKVRVLDPADQEVERLNNLQREIYFPVLDALTADWKAALGISGVSGNSLASAASDTGLAFMPTSPALTRSQAPSMSAQASPGLQKAGRPSQTQGLGVSGVIAGTNAQNVGDVNSSEIDPLIPRQAGTALSGEPQRPAAGVPDTGATQEQISLSAMSANFIRLLNLTFRAGRMTAGREALAQYNKKNGVIRARQRNDFSTLVHEGGHAFHDDRGVELDTLIRRHQNEVTQVAMRHYGAPQNLNGAQLKREGFAEFFRFYVTNPQLAQAEAPAFYQAFDNLLKASDPNTHKGLMELRRQVAVYSQQYPSTDVVKSFVKSARKPNLWDPRDMAEIVAEESQNARPYEGKPTAGGFFDWIRRGFFDQTSQAYSAAVDQNNGVRKLTYALLNVADRNKRSVDLKDADNPLELLAKASNSFMPAQLALQYGVRGYKTATVSSPALRDGIAVMMGASRGASYFDMNEQRMADANAYLVALRAVEEYQRYAAGEIQNPPVGFSEADARQAVRDLEAKYGQAFINGAKLVHRYARSLLDREFEAGLITPETYDEIKDKPNYVPLLRDMSDRNQEFGDNALTSGKTSLIKRFRGSSRDIIAPLDALMHRTFATEKRIAENETIKAMAKLAQKAGVGSGALVEKIPAAEIERIQIQMEDVFKKIIDDPNVSPADAAIMEGIFQASFGGDETMQIFRSAMLNERGERILTYRENGKLQAIQLGDDGIGESVFNVMRGIGNDKVPLLLDLVSMPSRALRFGITKWPDFLLVNYFRDQFMAGVSTNVGYIPFASGAKGMWDVVRRKKAFLDYSDAMGIMGGVAEYQIHKARVAKDIEGLKQKGYVVETFEFDGFSYKTMAGLVKGIFRLSELAEAGTRVGLFSNAYKRAIREGLSEYDAIQEASRIARDYIDFGRVGSKMAAANRLIPFLNANIQGLDVTIRKLAGGGAVGRKALSFMDENRTAPRIQAFVKTITAVTEGQRKGLNLTRSELNDLKNAQAMWIKMTGLALMYAAISFAFKDDEDYQETSEYLRQTGAIIPLGDGKIFYAPKPFEIALLGNFMERAIEYAYGDEEALGKFWENFTSAVTPPFIPPILSLGVGLGANLDISFGKPREVVPGYMERLPPEQRYLETTSEVAKKIGEAIDYPPAKINFLITSLFGSMGRDVTSALDGVINQDRADKGVDDSFITRRFIRDATRGGMSSQDFNELSNRLNGSLTQASSGYKRYIDTGDEIGASEYLTSLTDDERAWAILDRHFDAKFKRLHPIYRASQISTVVSGMRREVLSAKLKDTSNDGEFILLTAKQKRLVDDFITDFQRRERRNALITYGHPSWKSKKPLDTGPTLDLLRDVSPDAADELQRRMDKAKIYDDNEVASGWPELKSRLLDEGSETILSDLLP